MPNYWKKGLNLFLPCVVTKIQNDYLDLYQACVLASYDLVDILRKHSLKKQNGRAHRYAATSLGCHVGSFSARLVLRSFKREEPFVISINLYSVGFEMLDSKTLGTRRTKSSGFKSRNLQIRFKVRIESDQDFFRKIIINFRFGKTCF